MPDYTVPLSTIINEFQLERVFVPANDILIRRSDINRPALAISGFFTLFEPDRIQIIGNADYAYMEAMSYEERAERISSFLMKKPVAVIFCRSLPVFPEFVENAEKYGVAILRTPAATSDFTAAIIASLSVYLAERITRHGVLVEVYGEGILMLGDSGIGKSETAIELVKRGHRLIADDAVEIKRVSFKTLVGSAPDSIRYYAELRGIGIVDIRRIFGMGSVKDTEKIDLVVKLEPWDSSKCYDRMGIDSEQYDIMGIQVPMLTIPVRPGRNLAVIIEIAAMNNRQKRMGFDSAHELNDAMISRAHDISEKMNQNK